jgi:aminoglycoside 6'-N-acetyltransferase
MLLDARIALRPMSLADVPLLELGGRPIGAMQIIDPHTEATHYWGEIEPNLRAIDIWIGAAEDLSKGYGETMMRRAFQICFAEPTVTAIVSDPLASNTRAQSEPPVHDRVARNMIIDLA